MTSKLWKESAERLQMPHHEYWHVLTHMVESMEPTISHETRLYRAKKLLDPWFGPKTVTGNIVRVDIDERMSCIENMHVTPLVLKGSPEYLVALREMIKTWEGLAIPYASKYTKATRLLTGCPSQRSGYWSSGQGAMDRRDLE